MKPTQSGPIRAVFGKSQEQVRQEWDRVAELRNTQISSGVDLSFHHVLSPTVLSLLNGENTRRVLDVGCGTGHLTNSLAAVAGQVVGVDMSSSNIALAKKTNAKTNNVDFVTATVEALSREHHNFTVVVANMTMMTTLDLDTFCKACSCLLDQGGAFIWTITHPWFWPIYWGYDSAEWFDYSTEIQIEAPFSISRDNPGPTTTHVHRPLHRYSAALAASGFILETLEEPMPPKEAIPLYPIGWDYPRFLAARCRKLGEVNPAPESVSS